eukprot:CAMPEP_0202902698 /NCGR_PEP_ID=MMETSP1392-20130828/17003_1 /ASSEMBLY_ACC=CAM_ASM_000868 /TAXON_ID=225041 /ORGANISM="Chlamydomonas chlamydogama, Strain SAG 11-48b" /LENGTH=107 /DNA_ID=CAMNT_0049589505 /DNA_START=362 /DNA_END=686 /DNA_ORIENTATION=-
MTTCPPSSSQACPWCNPSFAPGAAPALQEINLMLLSSWAQDVLQIMNTPTSRWAHGQTCKHSSICCANRHTQLACQVLHRASIQDDRLQLVVMAYSIHSNSESATPP